ncbi:type VI secretion protein [Sphingomonas sp. Leaf67]|uniref:type IV secretion system protein VirB10 n=1 Tax=Sphingomonas sp. Leaf67 TaxID=1736230 RepID=UPI0006F48B18|nr:type IV secretion system protein VirB10 [Sphingomonas sp. Leaf67]KQN90719.1 type VI secretion protein [Sphingomonas sp. Leaf67]
MVGNVIDRGGEVAVDTVPPGEQDTPIARSGGWGNIAFFGAGLGLLGALGGIVIGYAAFHRTVVTTNAAQPAKPSERSVEDVMNSPNAQRAALAGQLGQPGAPATDVFGRPIAGASGQTTVDANGNTVAAPQGTAVASNGNPTPEQRRAEQARAMADAARRSPIMAFGSTSTANASGEPQPQQGDLEVADAGQSAVRRQSVDASGFGDPNDDVPAAATKGPFDFSDQLGHSAIQTVRATTVGDRNLLLSAGTVIPCTLQTAINSTQAGFVSCVINHDVYSESGRIVLLDKGTKVLGQYSGGITQGQARLFVVWTRALSPRGVAIDLGSPAADSLGRAGLPGGVDTQFWARFGLGLVISVLEDASNIAGRALAGNGSNTTQVPSTTGQAVLSQTMQIRPILKKNQGDTAAIFVAKDFDFRSVYEVGLRR